MKDSLRKYLSNKSKCRSEKCKAAMQCDKRKKCYRESKTMISIATMMTRKRDSWWHYLKDKPKFKSWKRHWSATISKKSATKQLNSYKNHCNWCSKWSCKENEMGYKDVLLRYIHMWKALSVRMVHGSLSPRKHIILTLTNGRRGLFRFQFYFPAISHERIDAARLNLAYLPSLKIIPSTWVIEFSGQSEVRPRHCNVTKSGAGSKCSQPKQN